MATCAGVLSAIPIDEETLYPLYPSTRIVLNTIGLWASPADAVQWTSDNYLQNTTGLAIQNPEVLKSGFLSDFIVGKKLFVQYLKKQCLPFYGQRSELRRRIEESPWSVPVRVYGYNSNDVLFGGDVFEAETDCVNLMGQVCLILCKPQFALPLNSLSILSFFLSVSLFIHIFYLSSLQRDIIISRGVHSRSGKLKWFCICGRWRALM